MKFPAILTSIALLGSLFSPFVNPSHAQGKDNAHLDAIMLDMAQAYKQRDRRAMTALLPQLQGYVLEPWAAYWELSSRLPEASTADIQSFLTRFAGSYQEDRLRADWLLQLGRNKNWEAVNREFPLYRMNDERSVRCYGLQARYNTISPAVVPVAQEIQDIWLTLRDADPACANAAEQLINDKKLSPQTAWLRARLGMENDRLRVTLQAVEMLSTDWAGTVSQIYLNPAHYLDEKLTAIRPKTRELVTLALIRLAYLDASAAADELNKLRWKTQLTHEERSWVWGVIGKRAAQKLSADAPSFFAKGAFEHMHEDHLVWATRAALRAGRWAQVQQAISAMPLALRDEPAWIYWHARAVLAQKPAEAARTAAQQKLQNLASSKGFYEQLALEETGQRISTPPSPAPLNTQEKEAARRNPGLTRALHAIKIGLRSEGVREWNYSTNMHTPGGMDDRSLLAAADLACRNAIWDRCINTSERTKTMIDAEQRFPMPFKTDVQARTQRIGLEAAYVYGLIRQESRFITDARSSVGASGLMQVMPATAKWTAKKIGLTDFQPHQITEQSTNITIGTGYLKLVLDNFNGSMPMAAAAYNAGPNRPRIWRGPSGSPTLEGAIWAENIPFSETRDYVKKVLANTTNYAALLTGQPQSLKARLGTVGPKDADTTEQGLDLP
jgi:soluble lytic murein transglycosylase